MKEEEEEDEEEKGSLAFSSGNAVRRSISLKEDVVLS
jgi:hypothetical protein